MIDLKLLRTDPELVRASLKRRGSPVDLDRLIALDADHRRLLQEVEAARAEQNQAGKRIADAAGAEKQEAILEMRRLSDRLKAQEAELAQRAADLDDALSHVPNLVHPDSPDGSGDDANRLVRTVGTPPTFPFTARDHLDIGEALGIIDVERAGKVSGSRFAFLLGAAALLELSLVRMVMDRVFADGFVPVIPPVLVRREAMYGTGFFPTDEAQVYRCADDDLYLAGTSEVPIASMHSREVLPAETLPRRYLGYSTCFRREAGTYGKDTRGIIRVHQFDKAELFSFCLPEDSDDELHRILAHEEGIFQALEIPYRVLEICAGDLADPNYRKFDIEAWLPGSGRWLEMTSCSNDTDYQARRLGIRTKRVAPAGGTSPGTDIVHTLNGTALAMGRAIVALLENHQQADGSVLVPPALRPYLGTELIGARS
ncbi:MAG TPA: serine--tRNA ligase [Actinomycetota bacterium]|nr:serine--tRNA ligase [Actinomycetota bacterium]